MASKTVEDISIPKWVNKCLNETKVEDMREAEKYQILREIESIWFDVTKVDRFHVNRTVSQIFHGHLNRVANPYSLTVFLFENSRDFTNFKTTGLSFFILKEFDKWLHLPQTQHKVDKKKLLTTDLRKYVYKITTGRNFVYFDMVVKVFELHHDGNEYFVPFVRYFAETQKYKEASVTITKLGLQKHFKINEVIIPLLLQDKVNMMENYLIGQKDLQLQAVQMLDNLCSRETSMDDFIHSSGVDLSTIKRAHLSRKTLSKLAVRLMKLYEIPAELCPNTTNARGFGAIKYLLYKRYIDKSMGSGSWEEMIEAAVGTNVYLQEQLVEQLMCYNEFQEAVKWANTFNLPDSSLPGPVLEAKVRFAQQLADGTGQTGNAEEDWESEVMSDKDMSVYYHQMSLSLDHVTMVDSKETLRFCSERILVPGSVIGIDSEWKPTLGTETTGVAIIQLAVHDHVFLLDILSLTLCIPQGDFTSFMRMLFCNPDTVKLGYGFDTDIHQMVKSFVFLKDVFLSMKRFVDMATLAHNVLQKNQLMLDESKLVDDGGESTSGAADEPVAKIIITPTKEEKGLSELVRQCLGRPLCKNEQMSNWEKRPLRTEQVIYASLDAFVLLEIYDYLQSYCTENNFEVDMEPKTKLHLDKKSQQEKKKARAAGLHVKGRKGRSIEQERNRPTATSTSQPRRDQFTQPE